VGDHQVLRKNWWYIAAVMVVVSVLASAAHAVSSEAAQEPSPEELWEAYPLDPGQAGTQSADPAPTPTAAPARRTDSPAQTAAEADDGGPLVLVLAGVVAAFAVGLGAGDLRRRRRRRAGAAAVAERTPEPAAAGAAAAMLPPRPMAVPPLPARRFARPHPWPEEAASTWTCEIDWKPGYIKSGFRAMAAPPGGARRTRFGQSRPIKWTLMSEPEPPTDEMVEVLRELVTALTQDGWVRIGPGGPWYAQRFLWAGDRQPRPLVPLKGKEANA
jgi:hypothetical protein